MRVRSISSISRQPLARSPRQGSHAGGWHGQGRDARDSGARRLGSSILGMRDRLDRLAGSSRSPRAKDLVQVKSQVPVHELRAAQARATGQGATVTQLTTASVAAPGTYDGSLGDQDSNLDVKQGGEVGDDEPQLVLQGQHGQELLGLELDEDDIEEGSFQVNGQTVQVYGDDSLEDIVARIEAEVEDVRASLDGETRRITVERELELSSDTTGLLEALVLESGRFGREGEALAEGQRLSAPVEHAVEDPEHFREELRSFLSEVGHVFTMDVSGVASSAHQRTQTLLESAFQQSFEDLGEHWRDGRMASSLGLLLDFSSPGPPTLDVDAARLDQALRFEAHKVTSLLYGDPSDEAKPGLIARVEGALGYAADQLLGAVEEHSVLGLRLDLSA